MKRWLFVSVLLVVAYAAGFVSGAVKMPKRSSYQEEYFRKSITDLRQRIYYGRSDSLVTGVPARMVSQANSLDSSKSTGSITLSYVGGMGSGEQRLRLSRDGRLSSEIDGQSETITTLSADQCTTFFQRVLNSGILSYSEAVTELKKDLLPPEGGLTSVTDCPVTEIRISVPELNLEKTISIYAPEVELKQFPDIIEFQFITELEKEMLALVPKGHPLRH